MNGADVGWRTIDTAPKDGTEVVLLGSLGGFQGERVRACIGRWCDPDEDGCFLMESGWLWQSPGFSDRMEPTHWIPLPATPSDQP